MDFVVNFSLFDCLHFKSSEQSMVQHECLQKRKGNSTLPRGGRPCFWKAVKDLPEGLPLESVLTPNGSPRQCQCICVCIILFYYYCEQQQMMVKGRKTNNCQGVREGNKRDMSYFLVNSKKVSKPLLIIIVWTFPMPKQKFSECASWWLLPEATKGYKDGKKHTPCFEKMLSP